MQPINKTASDASVQLIKESPRRGQHGTDGNRTVINGQRGGEEGEGQQQERKSVYSKLMRTGAKGNVAGTGSGE